MRFWGIDPKLRGIAVCCPDLELWEEVNVEASDRGSEIWDLVGWFKGMPIEAEDIVAIEAPIAGASGNVQTAVGIAVTVGAVLAETRGWGFLVAPASWKAAIVGHGHADKPDIRAWLEASDPQAAQACGRSKDLVDATCLAFYAEYRYRTGLAG